MVNEFSGLNNLKNLSMSPVYGTMLGYTQKELEENFAGFIEQGIKDTGMSREAYLAKVREMYGGYRFSPGSEMVYNPVSVGLFFTRGHGKMFDDYWIETGLMKLMWDVKQAMSLDVRDDLVRGMGASALKTFDVADVRQYAGHPGRLQALLLQTGYLTIDSYDEACSLYYLRFPNEEVQQAYKWKFTRK